MSTSIRFKPTLAFIVLFLMKLPASGYQGVRLESDALKQLQSPQVFLLKDLLNKDQPKYLGIDYYEKQKRQELIKNAESYALYRQTKNVKTKLEFLAKCERSPNAFCDFEKDRLSKDVTPEKKPPKESNRQIRKWILEADLEHLQELKYHELTSAFKDLSNVDKLEPLILSLKQTEGCASAVLLNSVAAKLEEYFPDERFITDAKSLYSKSVECGDDSASLKAAYRLSILNIWKDQCEIAQSLLPSVEIALNDFQSRAKYWRLYCAEKQPVAPNIEKASIDRDLDLKNESLINFQNILVHGDQVQAQISNDQNRELQAMNRSIIDFNANKLIEAVEALIVIEESGRAAELVENLFSRSRNSEPEFKLYVAFLMHSTRNSIAEFHILSQLFVESPRMIHESTLKMYFPLEYYESAKEISTELDPFIILSIIRQESAFNPKARSKAGARGLMQVMLPTAKKIALLSSRKLFDPSTNIKVGVKLFLNQVQRFGGDIELALAAYNAGRLKVEAWQKRYPSTDKMLFLDLIPYKETREYVTMILRNYYWYQRLYGDKNSTKSAYKMPSLIEKINLRNSLATGLKSLDSKALPSDKTVKNFDTDSN